MGLKVCDTKVFYDTEFEATIAAAKHRTDMRVYKCGTHYHLTHADPRKSIGVGHARHYARCPHCKQIYYRQNNKYYLKHFNKKCLENSNNQEVN